MKTRLLGLTSSVRATVAGNVSGPSGLKCSGRAVACRVWTSALSNESTSASASLARRRVPFIIVLSLVLALSQQIVTVRNMAQRSHILYVAQYLGGRQTQPARPAPMEAPQKSYFATLAK